MTVKLYSKDNSLKKNCYGCDFLAYYEKESFESFDQSGFYCNKREYRSQKEEDDHLKKLESETYRNAPKKCSAFIEGDEV